MVWEHVVSHIILPSTVAGAAAFGAWRCGRLLRYGRDPRLLKLMWFYLLFAASLISIAIWTGQLAADIGQTMSEHHAGDGSAALKDVHRAYQAGGSVDLFLVAHHVLMLASLSIAIAAFSHRRVVDHAFIGIGFAVFAPFIQVVLAVEAAMTLYLAVRAILNHMERRTPGALQVAVGFFLFFLGHLGYFVFHHPGTARIPLGDVFALVGIVLLVQLLPRPST